MSLRTDDESLALARLAGLVAEPKKRRESVAYASLAKMPVVYFVQAGVGGPIKIGRTDALRSRLNALRTGQSTKIIVLGLLPDQPKTEQQMHALFHRERLEGEWFAPSLELLKFISMHTARPR